MLNADDPRVRAMAARTEAAVLAFGESPRADVQLDDIALDELRPAGLHRWARRGARSACASPSAGGTWSPTPAPRSACVGAAGGDVAAGAAALSATGLSPRRMQIVRTASGGLIVDDCYNANPTSMRAALAALAELPARRRVALLGLMAEIADAAAEHEAILAEARARDIEVIVVGTHLYGVPPTDDPCAAIGSVAGGDALLVKGSRVVGLEQWVAVLAAL